jgi:hypothetical protein
MLACSKGFTFTHTDSEVHKRTQPRFPQMPAMLHYALGHSQRCNLGTGVSAWVCVRVTEGGRGLSLKIGAWAPKVTPVTQIPSGLCLCVSFGSFGLFLGVKHIAEVTLGSTLRYARISLVSSVLRPLPVCSLGMITSCFDSCTVVCLGTRGR